MAGIQYEKKEVRNMKRTVTQKVKISALFVLLVGVFVAGCTPQTGSTTRTYYENLRFVPSIHVEDNSFGVTSGAEYRGCGYDQYYDGYWCPKN